MMVSKVIDIEIANICCAAATPGHTEVFSNTGEGVAIQFAYVAHGGAQGVSTATGDKVVFAEGTLFNLSHMMHAPLEVTLFENPSVWAAVNPKLRGRLLDLQLVRDEEVLDVPAKTVDHYVFSVIGQLSVGDSTIPELKFARVAPGLDFTVRASSGAVGMVLSARDAAVA